MVLRNLCFIFLFFAEIYVCAQEFDFKFSFTIPEQNQLWIPDNTGNVYLYGKNTLTKASQGQLPSFSQSIKSIGNIDQILPVNALKTYLFSKDQQQLCLIDNTLSMQSQCLDLEEFDILYAQACAISSRPDLVYVYDQFNSSLYLINTKNNTVVQKVSNLEGIIGHELEISEILEYNNDLFFKTWQNEIFELDMFLNLKKKFTSLHGELLFYKEYIVELKNDTLVFKHMISEEIKKIQLPNISKDELKINGNSFYFSNDKEISVYEFNPG